MTVRIRPKGGTKLFRVMETFWAVVWVRSSTGIGGPSLGLMPQRTSNISDIESRKEQPRQDRPGEQHADRGLLHPGQPAVNHQHDGRGDEDTEGPRGADDPRRESPVVAAAQQRRAGHQSHGHDRGADDAGGGGEDRGDDDDRQPQSTAKPAQNDIEGIEEPLGDLGSVENLGHENKQGDGDQGVVEEQSPGVVDKQVEQRRYVEAVVDQAEKGGDAGQGDGQRVPQGDTAIRVANIRMVRISGLITDSFSRFRLAV